MRWIIGLLIVLVAGFAAYVRFAPVDVARWHVAPSPRAPGDVETAGSFMAVRALTVPADDALAAVVDVASRDPATLILAGGADSGLVTFETRSTLWRFPDYTTVTVVEHDGIPVLILYARLRFGQADLGVNKARVQAWLSALGPMISAP